MPRHDCDCGRPLPPPRPLGAWGEWRCRTCGRAYCQDCGAQLDENDECTAFTQTEW